MLGVRIQDRSHERLVCALFLAALSTGERTWWKPQLFNNDALSLDGPLMFHGLFTLYSAPDDPFHLYNLHWKLFLELSERERLKHGFLRSRGMNSAKRDFSFLIYPSISLCIPTHPCQCL